MKWILLWKCNFFYFQILKSSISIPTILLNIGILISFEFFFFCHHVLIQYQASPLGSGPGWCTTSASARPWKGHILTNEAVDYWNHMQSLRGESTKFAIHAHFKMLFSQMLNRKILTQEKVLTLEKVLTKWNVLTQSKVMCVIVLSESCPLAFDRMRL